MSNELVPVLSASSIAITENCNAKTLDNETLDALSKLKEEVHGILQLPPEDLAKIDHVEWRLDWKPVLTARLYLKKP